MGLLDIFKLNKTKKDNSASVGSYFPIIFSNTPRTYQDTLLDIINRASVSYNVSLTIWETNSVVSRFIDLISESMNTLVVVDRDWNEITTPLAKQIISEANDIFSNEWDWAEYIYHSISMMVCTGMKVATPTIIDDNNHAIKVEVLDNRKIILDKKKDWTVEVVYWNKKIPTYHKTIIKPDINRRWYGACVFSWAVKDAILDTAIRDTGIALYGNRADPSTLYMLDKDLAGMSIEWKTVAQKFEEDLYTKYQSPEKSWKPLVSTAVKDVKVIDSSEAVIKSLDLRLYNSNMLWMQLWVDIRWLWYMRDWGSQAELWQVYNQLNSIIERWWERLSKSLTVEYTKFVADMWDLHFKFEPTYFRNKQQHIANALIAHKQKAVDDKYIQDLLSNE